MSDLSYRFTEIMTAVELMPDEPTEDFSPLLPNLTRDLHESELFTAILCQSMKSDREFNIKLAASLNNSAVESVNNTQHPTEDDLTALALSANILWSMGSGIPLLVTLGLIGSIAGRSDQDLPSLVQAIFKSSKGVEDFGKLDPYRILKGDYTPAEMMKETMDIDIDEAIERITDMVDDDIDIDELKDFLRKKRGEQG